MALDPNPIGKAIADYLYASRPDPGQPPIGITDLETLWQGVMNLIYADIKATMDVLPAAHSGTSLSNPTGQAVTGTVTSGPGSGGTVVAATSAPDVIIGKGSVV